MDVAQKQARSGTLETGQDEELRIVRLKKKIEQLTRLDDPKRRENLEGLVGFSKVRRTLQPEGGSSFCFEGSRHGSYPPNKHGSGQRGVVFQPPPVSFHVSLECKPRKRHTSRRLMNFIECMSRLALVQGLALLLC